MTFIDAGRGNVADLDRLARFRRAPHHALPLAERSHPQRLDQCGVDISRCPQVELLGDLVVFVDRAAIRTGKLASPRSVIVSSTVSRSSVELTAWLTSPSAVNFSTERVSSVVRSCSSLKRRTFSTAMTAWSAKVFRS